MSFFQIPGFGVFNKPLPDLIDHCADTAVSWIKNQVAQKKIDAPVEVEVPEVPETTEKVAHAPDAPDDSNASLAINLASSHSVLLEQSLRQQVLEEIVIPDTSGDEALARKLALEDARPPEPIKPVEERKATEPPKPMERPKVEEKKEESIFSTNQSSKTDRRKGVKDRHHHHRAHHSHKKIK